MEGFAANLFTCTQRPRPTSRSICVSSVWQTYLSIKSFVSMADSTHCGNYIWLKCRWATCYDKTVQQQRELVLKLQTMNYGIVSWRPINGLKFFQHYISRSVTSAFSHDRMSGPPQTGFSLRLIWRRTLDSRTPFHSKRIRRTHDSGLLWSQLMMLSQCFQKQQPVLLIVSKDSQFANSFTIGCLSFRSNFMLLVERILLRNQINFPFQRSYSRES